jgi:formylglycine-generating enzyme required for sulfatase activity
MQGNVVEWCQDWYHETYDGAPTDGSAWLSGGEQTLRILRGGAWVYEAPELRSTFRFRLRPDARNDVFGMRVVAFR